jgi:hypothetical protein
LLERTNKKGYGFKGHLGSHVEERIGVQAVRGDLEKDLDSAFESVAAFKPTAQSILDMVNSLRSLL